MHFELVFWSSAVSLVGGQLLKHWFSENTSMDDAAVLLLLLQPVIELTNSVLRRSNGRLPSNSLCVRKHFRTRLFRQDEPPGISHSSRFYAQQQSGCYGSHSTLGATTTPALQAPEDAASPSSRSLSRLTKVVAVACGTRPLIPFLPFARGVALRTASWLSPATSAGSMPEPWGELSSICQRCRLRLNKEPSRQLMRSYVKSVTDENTAGRRSRNGA